MYSIVSIQEDHSTCLRPSLTLLLPWLVSLPPEWKRNALWCWSCNDKVLTLPRQCQSESKRCWTQYNLKFSLSETQTFISEIPWNGILPNSNYGIKLWKAHLGNSREPDRKVKHSAVWLHQTTRFLLLSLEKQQWVSVRRLARQACVYEAPKRLSSDELIWPASHWFRFWSVTVLFPRLCSMRECLHDA
jgi:hypothetical protein